jgi:hypothetical protein
MILRLTLLALFALALALAAPMTVGAATPAPFPNYKYKVAALRIDSAATWDHSAGDPAARTWGSERTVATAKRIGQTSAWNWNVPMKGNLVGDYHHTALDTVQACSTTTDVGSLGAKAAANIVPLPRGRVLIAMGLDIGQSGAPYSALRESLRQQCAGAGSAYESPAVTFGLGWSISPGIDGGACDGYTLRCVILPRARFLQPRVLVTAPPTNRSYTEPITMIPYAYAQTWTLDLRRVSQCGRAC